MTIKSLGYGAAVLASVLATSTSGLASGGAFTRGCAARDMQILMLIEQGDTNNAVTAQKVNEAVRTMLHARMVCFEGHVPDALALYDDIARSLTSDWVLSGHEHALHGQAIPQ
jgi:hypothetical protein